MKARFLCIDGLVIYEVSGDCNIGVDIGITCISWRGVTEKGRVVIIWVLLLLQLVAAIKSEGNGAQLGPVTTGQPAGI